MTELMMKHVKRTVRNEQVSYKCRKGLWEACGQTDNESSVRREAEHYFVQYFDDGEYDNDNKRMMGNLGVKGIK